MDESQITTPLNYLPPETVIINEAGMYSLIFSSKLEGGRKAFNKVDTEK
ncbi:MAG: hypothetical protein IJQ47_06960 [Synergistaceae bacterium]|nr:hypothetical protein [Synergistaceae bacterium]